jgi:predicted DNA-binding transcriptional regulator AlpA
MSNKQIQTNFAEAEFNLRYITSTEILKRLDIARSSLLLARRAGRLPNAIRLPGQTFIWLRADVEPYLSAWATMLKVRRGTQA